MQKFTTQSMREIILWVESTLENTQDAKVIEFVVANPDKMFQESKEENYRYHSWRAWSDLATLNLCRMMTPHIMESGEVLIRFQRLNKRNSFHDILIEDTREKYGVDSPFAQITKREEPAFYYYYREALQNVNLHSRVNILNLGINSGDEFIVIRDMLPSRIYETMNLVGIDHSNTAIELAKSNLPESNVSLLCQDINGLDRLELEKSDLIISIGTLQSPNIDFKLLFMSLIQKYLTPTGAVILGFPNCRWIDGEMVYGAKAPNYNFSEMSLVIKDIYFCKKYLQQHKFRVTITGKEYLFLTATKIGNRV